MAHVLGENGKPTCGMALDLVNAEPADRIHVAVRCRRPGCSGAGLILILSMSTSSAKTILGSTTSNQASDGQNPAANTPMEN